MKNIPKIAIVTAKFNSAITEKLLKNTHQTLLENNFTNIDVHKVPGVCEIPFLINKFGIQKKYDGYIALGSVIKGETPHFDYVCKMVQEGILSISLKFDVPIIFGILTTENINQALERADDKKKNKGRDFALALIDLFTHIN